MTKNKNFLDKKKIVNSLYFYLKSHYLNKDDYLYQISSLNNKNNKIITGFKFEELIRLIEEENKIYNFDLNNLNEPVINLFYKNKLLEINTNISKVYSKPKEFVLMDDINKSVYSNILIRNLIINY